MKKILVIDDNAMMRMFLENYLGKTYEVVAVETPTEALKLHDAGLVPQMILADYHAKSSPEVTALNALSRQNNWADSPLFILTDDDKSEQRIDAFTLGAKDTMSKPFNPKELNMRMESMMGAVPATTTLRKVA